MSDGQSDNPGMTFDGVGDPCETCKVGQTGLFSCPCCGQSLCDNCRLEHRCTKMAPPGITFTGVDEHTNLDHLLSFWRPDMEFGILLSNSQQGAGRYPSFRWVYQNLSRFIVTNHATGRPARMAALHVCGTPARHGMLFGDVLVDMFLYVRRVQFNGELTNAEWDALMELCGRHRPVKFVVQLPVNDHHIPLDATKLPFNLQFLVDESGGRGRESLEWKQPKYAKADVGFAGGLGPDTVAKHLPFIRAVAQPGWWIDMESKIRDEKDRFDIFKCVAVRDAVDKYCKRELWHQ